MNEWLNESSRVIFNIQKDFYRWKFRLTRTGHKNTCNHGVARTLFLVQNWGLYKVTLHYCKIITPIMLCTKTQERKRHNKSRPRLIFMVRYDWLSFITAVECWPFDLLTFSRRRMRLSEITYAPINNIICLYLMTITTSTINHTPKE